MLSTAESTPLLRVVCAARCGGPGGMGRLIVEPGAVHFESGRSGMRAGIPPVIRARPPVVFMRARLLPPGFSSGLIVAGDEGTVTVFTWCGLRRRVKRALVDAEVAFLERPTWVSVGWAQGVDGGARM